MNIRPTIFLASVFLLVSIPTLAGTARTVDGTVHEGEIRFDQDKVLVTGKRGQPPVRLDVADLLQASFQTAQPVKKNTVQLGGGQLPGGWRPMDVGLVGTPGSVRFYNGVFAVKGAGSTLSGKEDSFYFVPQEIAGDATLTCRLADMQRGDMYAKVGLMIRASTDFGARNVCIYATSKLGVNSSRRIENRGETTHGNATPQPMPMWLRLTRKQNQITTYKSADGRGWVQVDRREIALDQRALFGMVVCSHDPAGTLAVTFDNIELRPGEPKDDDRRAPAAALPTGRAVVFRRGTTLANVQLTGVSDKTINLQRPDGKPMTVPIGEVARVVLAPLPPQIASKIPEHGTGVMLARGDFMEGNIQSFERGRVKLSSVLFGLSNLAAGSEAAVLMFNDLQPGQSAWIVRAADGSVYFASDLKIERDQLVITDESVGQVKVPSWNLLEIRTGQSRSELLISLTPQPVNIGGDRAVDPTVDASRTFLAGPASTVPMILEGTTPASMVSMRSGTSLTYALDGKYKVFLATVGVPQGNLPAVSVRYSVLIDGMESYRSPPCTSLDEPATVSVRLARAKTLTLRVDPCPTDLPATVLWADPALIR